MDLLEKMTTELIRRRYNRYTIRTYRFALKKFLMCVKVPPQRITKRMIYDYLLKQSNANKAASTMNVTLQAIKFVMEECLGKKFYVTIPTSKVSKRIPEFLTKEEVNRLFSVIVNPKQKLMIQLMYGAGLRVGELVRLRVKHLDFERELGWVRDGKGNKDRLFLIPQRIKIQLQQHIATNNLDYGSYLFPGQLSHYSIKSVQQIVKTAAKKAGIRKNIHPHTLRHSFATHIIESGRSVTEVQALLGHASLETTMVYVHAASPKLLNSISPLDRGV